MLRPMLDGKLLFPRNYVTAEDLQGRDATLTIESIAHEDLRLREGGKKRKPVITFKETTKKFVLNITNAEAIAANHGVRAEQWPGKRITLYPTTCTSGRDVVPCIRIRQPQRQSSLATEEFAGAGDGAELVESSLG